MSVRDVTLSALALLATLLVSLAPSNAISQTVWAMPTPYPDDNFHTVNIKIFAAEIQAATGGKLTIDIKAGGTLFKPAEIKGKVRTGAAPIGEILLSLYAAESPIFGADGIPFLATSFDEAAKLYAAQRPFLEKRLAEDDLVLLYSMPWPPQAIYAKKEIKTVDDLKGLSFRTYSPGTKRIAELVGAVPVQIEVPDMAAAFKAGKVDVTITSGATGVQARFWDFVSHYHDTRAWIPRNAVIAQKAALDALPADQLDAVFAAAKAAEVRGWAAAAKETADRVEQLKAQGMIVVEPAPALMDGLRRIGTQLAAEWQTSTGADGRALLEAYRKP